MATAGAQTDMDQSREGTQVMSEGSEDKNEAAKTDNEKATAEESETNKTASESPFKQEAEANNVDGDDEDLEEGELKDDDDDDDDEDEDEGMDDSKKASKNSNDDSDSDHDKLGTSSNSGSNSSSSSSSGIANEDKVKKGASSIKSSSSEDNRLGSYQHSYPSRHDSSSRQSPHSHHSHHSKRRLSPVSNQQARLVSMRAKLLEARSREIEMKFQKTKSLAPSSPIPPGPTRNLKTTIAKPPITYCENPNPINIVEPSKDSKKKSKKQKSTRHVSKQSSKKSKKRKKKSSSSKKRKKSKTSETPKKSTNSSDNIKTTSSKDIELPIDATDRQGPRTPPDNHVLTLDDKQIEWPSYLIKMTTTQPSISYSVNPDSVIETNSTDRSDSADLYADYSWYYNYFVNTFEMDKTQAQHQACSAIISSGNYDDEVLNKWLEQRGLTKQSTTDLDENKETFPFSPKDENSQQNHPSDQSASAKLPFRPTRPHVTTLKSQREIVLPNGKVLPVGTIQKIVHLYPRTDRVAPDIVSTYYDLY